MPEISVTEECESPIIYKPKRQLVTNYEYETDANGVTSLVSETQTTFEVVAEEDKVISVKSVDYDLVDKMIESGYQPKDYYAKNVIMVLTESSSLAYMESLKESIEEDLEE